ncbi:MAG: hypothetical protein AAFN17_05500 [Pseudomonadota bacterium]
MMSFRTAALAALVAPLIVLAAPAAEACSFSPGEDAEAAAAPVALAALPEGITRGYVRCRPGNERPLVVWTLRIDAEDSYVGVRDAPLFEPMPSNPFVRVGGVGLGRDAAFTLYMREHDLMGRESMAMPAEGKPYRLFGTLCADRDAHTLDCTLGNRRMKARVDIRDSDGDGTLDYARHEVSILAGDRLQVLRFATPYNAQSHRLIGHWVRAMETAGVL